MHEFSPNRAKVDQFLRESCPAFSATPWNKDDVLSEASDLIRGEIANLPDDPEVRASAHLQLDAFVSYLQANLLDFAD